MYFGLRKVIVVFKKFQTHCYFVVILCVSKKAQQIKNNLSI